MCAVCESESSSLADHGCAQLEELLKRSCSFGRDFMRLDVSQGTGGGGEAFSVADILEPEPSAREGEGRVGREIIRRRDGTGMSCGGGSLIGKKEVSVMLVSDHPPLIV